MAKITNTEGISLPLAAWLVYDDYDYNVDPDYISVTALMRPLRQIIIPPRIATRTPPDVADFIASSLGHAIHNSIEKAWTSDQLPKILHLLGYPEDIAERIKVNPTPEEMRARNDIIPVYVEQRAAREIDGYKIGGKFDLVADGIVQDNKSTSAWTSVFGGRDDEHRLQMSMYRWIDAGQPVRRITEDYCIVNYIFTDWSKMMSRTAKDYPQSRVATKQLPLLSLDETENYIRNKLALINQHKNTPEDQLPECTDEELWLAPPKFQYFSDPVKMMGGGRASKNFDTLHEANAHLAEKGKGIVKTIASTPKRCGYCPAFDGCTQKDRYL